jgi:putative nucleotidyltransferase with HDIG domain
MREPSGADSRTMPPGGREACAAAGGEPVVPSLWRYLPHALTATFAVVGIPIAAATSLPAAAGVRSNLAAAALAIVLAPMVATAGSAFWTRRPGGRDLLFNDLMLWGWVKRLLTERRLAETASLLGLHRGTGAAGLEPDRRVEVLERLAADLEARDAYTHGHSRRVARHAHMIAKQLGLPAEQVAKVRTAAAVHDVGKLSTPREILNKPGALTDEEFAMIKRHPGDGAELVAAIDDPDVVAMVRQHHERLDGTGYPDGLSGAEITLGARIIAVADTFDALTSSRPYRSPRKQKLALEILRREAGTKLDADVVAAFRGYQSGRRSATWSTLVLTIPDRVFAPLLWGAAPVAKTAAAAGAAVALGGSLMDMGPVGTTDSAAAAAHVTAAAPANVAPSPHAPASRQRVAGGGNPRAAGPGENSASDPGLGSEPGLTSQDGPAPEAMPGSGQSGGADAGSEPDSSRDADSSSGEAATGEDPVRVPDPAADVDRVVDRVPDPEVELPKVPDVRDKVGDLNKSLPENSVADLSVERP